MRGLLQISSARAPFRRAGLAWAVKGPIEVDIRDLDGERLVKLLADPNLTMTYGQEDGSFKPVEVAPELTADQAQVMINALGDALPPRAVPVAVVDDVASLTERLQRQADQIAELVDAGGTRADQISELVDKVSVRDARIAELEEMVSIRVNEITSQNEKISEQSQLIAAKDVVIEELQAEIAKLKAKPAPKPRAAPKD